MLQSSFNSVLLSTIVTGLNFSTFSGYLTSGIFGKILKLNNSNPYSPPNFVGSVYNQPFLSALSLPTVRVVSIIPCQARVLSVYRRYIPVYHRHSTYNNDSVKCPISFDPWP